MTLHWLSSALGDLVDASKSPKIGVSTIFGLTSIAKVSVIWTTLISGKRLSWGSVLVAVAARVAINYVVSFSYTAS